jgi:hypothetical protein
MLYRETIASSPKRRWQTSEECHFCLLIRQLLNEKRERHSAFQNILTVCAGFLNVCNKRGFDLCDHPRSPLRSKRVVFNAFTQTSASNVKFTKIISAEHFMSAAVNRDIDAPKRGERRLLIHLLRFACISCPSSSSLVIRLNVWGKIWTRGI